LPVCGTAFGAGAADDMPACCEATSFGIDDVGSPVDTLAGAVALGLASISSACEGDGSVWPGFNDSAELAVEGLGLGIGIANAGAGRIVLTEVAACCVD
jgi:hypothetical protein